MRGNNSNSSMKIVKIPINEFDFKTDPFLPKIDISDYIYIFGDYFSLDSTEPRTITTVSLIVDYDNMQRAALNDTLLYFDNYLNNSAYSTNKYNCSSFSPFISLSDS